MTHGRVSAVADAAVQTHECPNGREGARWSCYFCHRRVHHYDECECSARHPEHYATVCNECAVALDQLRDTTTTLGRVHAAVVRKAWFDGRGPFGGD